MRNIESFIISTYWISHDVGYSEIVGTATCIGPKTIKERYK